MSSQLFESFDGMEIGEGAFTLVLVVFILEPPRKEISTQPIILSEGERSADALSGTTLESRREDLLLSRPADYSTRPHVC
jgi:hypothetical protein